MFATAQFASKSPRSATRPRRPAQSPKHKKRRTNLTTQTKQRLITEKHTLIRPLNGPQRTPIHPNFHPHSSVPISTPYTTCCAYPVKNPVCCGHATLLLFETWLI